MLTAAEAKEISLITRVVPDGELTAAGLGLTRELARGSTEALAATKRLIWDGLGATTVTTRKPHATFPSR